MQTYHDRRQKNNGPSKPKPPTKQQIRQRPHVRCWHEGDYLEAFIHITVSKSGATWAVRENGAILARDIVLVPDAETALTRSVELARHWIRTHLSGAKIRVRSNLERVALFGAPSLPLSRRRRAA